MKKYYSNCEELPLYNFIKLVVHNDLSFIWIDPKDTDDTKLNEVWSVIMEEYNLLSGSVEYEHVLSLSKEITIINNRLMIIQAVVNVLSKGYDNDVCDILRNPPFSFHFSYSEDTIMNDLRLTVTTSKRFLIQKMESEKELAGLQSNDKASEMDFINLNVQLSRFLGYKIDSKQTNMLEFIAYLDQYKKYNQPIPA